MYNNGSGTIGLVCEVFNMSLTKDYLEKIKKSRKENVLKIFLLNFYFLLSIENVKLGSSKLLYRYRGSCNDPYWFCFTVTFEFSHLVSHFKQNFKLLKCLIFIIQGVLKSSTKL